MGLGINITGLESYSRGDAGPSPTHDNGTQEKSAIDRVKRFSQTTLVITGAAIAGGVAASMGATRVLALLGLNPGLLGKMAVNAAVSGTASTLCADLGVFCSGTVLDTGIQANFQHYNDPAELLHRYGKDSFRSAQGSFVAMAIGGFILGRALTVIAPKAWQALRGCLDFGETYFQRCAEEGIEEMIEALARIISPSTGEFASYVLATPGGRITLPATRPDHQEFSSKQPMQSHSKKSTSLGTTEAKSIYSDILLSREDFRQRVFTRDNHSCVFCGRTAVDAHHIMERRLWPDGGYYLDNGASLCETHHIQCETTAISLEEVRRACGITRIIIPPHLYADQKYDKWGNPILPNGQRMRGELFDDASVQKILTQGAALPLFTSWVKYPRTYHLPWSEGMNDDDRMMKSIATFEGQRVIVTEKMDGENTTFYSDHSHARSVDSHHQESQAWVKQFWGSIRHDIPEGWRVCGENLYAKHSIHYTQLPTYFMGFSIWNERNNCLSWDDTLKWFELLGISPAPVLYDGIFDEQRIRTLWTPADWATREGYVVRLADPMGYGEFRHKVGKFVRPQHKQTAPHWRRGQVIERNLLDEATLKRK